MKLDTARKLALEIRESEEFTAFKKAEKKAMSNEYVAGLIKAFGVLQSSLQMQSLNGTEPDETQVQQFSRLSSLLYDTEEGSAYLLAQLRLQKIVGDILQIITKAAELPLSEE
ncbi:MAG: YlbF family regulator [Eubacteriales bacterium]|nr:YlbF family regulator [Eubacteriales bacterium]